MIKERLQKLKQTAKECHRSYMTIPSVKRAEIEGSAIGIIVLGMFAVGNARNGHLKEALLEGEIAAAWVAIEVQRSAGVIYKAIDKIKPQK